MHNKTTSIVYWLIFAVIALLALVGLIWSFLMLERIEVENVTINQNQEKTGTDTGCAPCGSEQKTEINSDYGYNIKYPSSAAITYADKSEIAGTVLENSVCTTITTDYGHVIIAAKEGIDNFIICGRTGVGSDYLEFSDTIEIEEVEYTANGFYERSGNIYTDFLVVLLNNGDRIEYGIDEMNTAAFGMSLEEAREELEDIVKSYQSI